MIEAILAAEGEAASPKRRLPSFIETHGKRVSGDGKLWLRVVDPSGKYWSDPGCRPGLRFVSQPLASYDRKAPDELLQIELRVRGRPAGAKMTFILRTALFNMPPEVDGVATLRWCYRGEVWRTEGGWAARLGSAKFYDKICR